MPKINSPERSERIPPVRVTPEELQEIQKRAEDLSMTLSEYIRFVALNAVVKVETKK